MLSDISTFLASLNPPVTVDLFPFSGQDKINYPRVYTEDMSASEKRKLTKQMKKQENAKKKKKKFQTSPSGELSANQIADKDVPVQVANLT